ncbi:MAG: hypothetical protein A2Y77_15875 [Planctomycetes bacterium RBG_13_62_9]|nr:MAG: hypothetical protein A2Y77_15875 [Planctomycetes bacterium RBG_13_62_9]
MTLYVSDNCPTCSMIRESLEEVAVAHDVVAVPDGGPSDRLPAGMEPPVLVDDDRVIQGSREIFAYIDELREFKRLWLKYQSDTCYLDEETGEGC